MTIADKARTEEMESCYLAFGTQVKKRREELGFNQTELANILRIKRTSITNLEAGRQRLRLHDVLLLAGLLRIDLNALRPNVRVKKTVEVL